jgi:hypothetical protein
MMLRPSGLQLLDRLALGHHVSHLCIHVKDIRIMYSGRSVTTSLANDL